jgi:putative ABC transport system permease protein
MVALLVLTMAIGIAACMTAMTVFGALAGEPLPRVSNHLYTVTMDARQSVHKDGYDYTPDNLLSWRDAKALVDAHRANQQMAVAKSLTAVATADDKTSSMAYGFMGYGPLPSILGVPLRYGRPWTRAEQAAHDPVVILGARVAEKLFGTANAVGRSVKMGDKLFRVIGVTASWKPRVSFMDLVQSSGGVLPSAAQFFVPARAALAAGVAPLTAGECAKGAPVVAFQSTQLEHCRWLETWVALNTPAEVDSYQRFVGGYADAQHDAGRFAYPPQAKLYGTLAWMNINDVVPDDVGLNLMLAGAFLVLCMVNVAGLLAARFLRRQADVAIRRALGASKRHVFAQHLVEAGMLGLAGGIVALPLTWMGLWIVRMQTVSYADAAQFQWNVFAELAVLSLVVGLIVGMLPAWRVCRQPPALKIKVA